MADKGIINTADLKDPIQTTQIYLTMNKKIWTKTYSNHSFLKLPSSTLLDFPHSIRKAVSQSAKQIIRLASSAIARKRKIKSRSNI